MTRLCLTERNLRKLAFVRQLTGQSFLKNFFALPFGVASRLFGLPYSLSQPASPSRPSRLPPPTPFLASLSDDTTRPVIGQTEIVVEKAFRPQFF